MAFGSKMQNGARSILVEQPIEKGRVADIPLLEMVSGMLRNGGEVLQVASIGKLVEVTTGVPTCASQSSTKFDPMKPAPPVTRIGDKSLNITYLCDGMSTNFTPPPTPTSLINLFPPLGL